MSRRLNQGFAALEPMRRSVPAEWGQWKVGWERNDGIAWAAHYPARRQQPVLDRVVAMKFFLESSDCQVVALRSAQVARKV